MIISRIKIAIPNNKLHREEEKLAIISLPITHKNTEIIMKFWKIMEIKKIINLKR